MARTTKEERARNAYAVYETLRTNKEGLVILVWDGESRKSTTQSSQPYAVEVGRSKLGVTLAFREFLRGISEQAKTPDGSIKITNLQNKVCVNEVLKKFYGMQMLYDDGYAMLIQRVIERGCLQCH